MHIWEEIVKILKIAIEWFLSIFKKTEEERKEKIFIKTFYIKYLMFFILTKVWNNFYKDTLLFSFKNNHVVDNIYISYFYIN